MPRVVHLVATAGFAGVERYVCAVAPGTAQRGWEVVVVGGDERRMPAALGDGVRWEPGATAAQSLRSLARVGRCDISHAHMTLAEAIAVLGRRLHRAAVVATRHFAARRGSSAGGRLLAPWIGRHISREIAVSQFVARHLERPPAAVIVNAAPDLGPLWRRESRTVLVLARLEPEKDAITALRAWRRCGLHADGWTLRVAGDGSQRAALERHAAREHVAGVEFAGWVDDAPGELARAGMLLASTPAESVGLSVLEAMAAGVPVVASAAGGHLETVGLIERAPLFAPGDADAAAAALRALFADAERERLSAAGRRVVASRFTLDEHVGRLLAQYDGARARALR